MLMRDVPVKFWIKWKDADPFERIDLIKELNITKTYAKLHYPSLDGESAMDVVATMLNSYFEDLLEALEESK